MAPSACLLQSLLLSRYSICHELITSAILTCCFIFLLLIVIAIITIFAINAGSGSAGAYGSSQAVKDVLGNLLTSVTLAQPSDQDQQAIMQGLFPDLACLLPCAMCMLHLVRRAAGQLPPHHLATE